MVACAVWELWRRLKPTLPKGNGEKNEVATVSRELGCAPWRRLKPTLLKDRKAHDEDGVVVATLVQNRRPEASGTKGKGGHADLKEWMAVACAVWELWRRRHFY